MRHTNFRYMLIVLPYGGETKDLQNNEALLTPQLKILVEAETN
jgi:hypothetical protein